MPQECSGFGWRSRFAGIVLLSTCSATLLVSCSSTSPIAGSASTTKSIAGTGSLLGHAGRWLTDAEGRVVVLHGMNVVYKLPPYTPAAMGFGDVAASTLSDLGLDVVRLGVIYSAVEPEPGKFDAAYLDSISQTVSLLAQHGIYTLLDFHQDEMSTAFGGEGFPSWSVETNGLPERRYVFPLGYYESPALGAAFDNFWSDRTGPGAVGLQELYARAWQHVASRFEDDPYVLGYDLFNEPWPAGASASELGSFYVRTIAAIRSVDRRHLIFYEPYVTFDFGSPTELPRFSDTRLGMSFHDYCLQSSTSNEVACGSSESATVQNALARSHWTQDALMMTEFGASSDEQDLGRVVGMADEHQLSWTEWQYCGCGDPTGSLPPSEEALVYNPRLPASGGNVDLAKLLVLVEPYPRAVAGTPLTYGYEASNHRFNLVYSTTGPGGRRFGAGYCTNVVVPSVQYPHGYSTVVRGGRVVSPGDSGLLQIVPRPGSSRVSLTVLPADNGHTSTIPGSQACPMH
jgi:endoglycosylceramidase